MSTMTATEAKQNFGELLMRSQQEPVEITRNGKRIGVFYADNWRNFDNWRHEDQATHDAKLDESLAQISRGETYSSEDVVARGRELIKELARQRANK
ncbi:type II toxin-antitoxin system prevent-host-death family antitoxin [Robiginitomaculum antarcticum]|uniref:type II toxin-antitoxin system prevent-host-death family antitoxin n=1 Tax=Robiginitomaculum antarcticum TaxID=437507 RepID=UPI0003A26480|nr:type II toxin-antitoxin system prevent-host-death family antitoxin [Robiginitomaculum antarcticum]